MSVPTNSRVFHPTALVIGIQHSVARTLYELLSIDVREEVVLIRLVLPVLEEFSQNSAQRCIQRDQQRLSILRHADRDNSIVEVEILHLYVHQTSLPDSSAEQEIRHNPALVLNIPAFPDIWPF